MWVEREWREFGKQFGKECTEYYRSYRLIDYLMSIHWHYTVLQLITEMCTISYLIIRVCTLQTCIVQIADNNHHITPWYSNRTWVYKIAKLYKWGGEGYTESVYCVSVERGGAMGVEKKWRWGKCAECCIILNKKQFLEPVIISVHGQYTSTQ